MTLTELIDGVWYCRGCGAGLVTDDGRPDRAGHRNNCVVSELMEQINLANVDLVNSAAERNDLQQQRDAALSQAQDAQAEAESANRYYGACNAERVAAMADRDALAERVAVAERDFELEAMMLAEVVSDREALAERVQAVERERDEALDDGYKARMVIARLADAKDAMAEGVRVLTEALCDVMLHYRDCEGCANCLSVNAPDAGLHAAQALAAAAEPVAAEPECTCGCPDNTPTQHGAFCAKYGRFRDGTAEPVFKHASASYGCEKCGRWDGMDAAVDHNVWAQIAATKPDGEWRILCLWCMDDIAAEIGLPKDTLVRLYFPGRTLSSVLPEGARRG